MYGGIVGVGKSDALMGIPVKQRWRDRPLYTYPSFKMAFRRPTKKEQSLELIPRFREFYEALGARKR